MSEAIEAIGARRVRTSVFVKLVAILMAMATSLLFMVAAFFRLVGTPTVNAAMEGVVREYATLAAASGLDRDAALGIRDRLDVYVRYEGPPGTWTVAAGLPTIAEARRRMAEGTSLWRVYYVVPARDGGEYLFAWFPGHRLHDAHLYLLLLLLVQVIKTALPQVYQVVAGSALPTGGDLSVFTLTMPIRVE